MPKDFKRCIYCHQIFKREDFPSTFDRQLTCGSEECQGKRRKELFRKKYNNRRKQKKISDYDA